MLSRRLDLAGNPPGWDVDEGGRFLLLPLAERDLAWVLESCRDEAEGDWYVLPDGAAVVFARERDLAFARYVTHLPPAARSGGTAGPPSTPR